MRRLLVLVASCFFLVAARGAEPTTVADRTRDLVAQVGSATHARVIARVIEAPDAVEGSRLAREAADQGARRIVLILPQAAFEVEQGTWRPLVEDLRGVGASLQVYGVGDDGAASSVTWSGERSPLLEQALAAKAVDADLGTGVAWEPSVAAAFERAAREDRLVLLVQLSGRFDAVPET
jgi:hypothetical protein